MLHKPPLRIVYALSFTKIYKMHTCFIRGMNAFFMLSKNNNIITEKICQIQILHKLKTEVLDSYTLVFLWWMDCYHSI